MDREFAGNRFAACLLGLTLGDALGRPAADLTPYQVLRKFQFIDGFFKGNGEPGQYTCESRAALAISSHLLKHGNLEGLDEPLANLALHDPPDIGSPARGFLPMFVPVGLYAAAKGLDDHGVKDCCKKIVVLTKRSRSDAIAGVLLAFVIREIVRNHDSLLNPYELYDSDRSLLSRAMGFCLEMESKTDETEDRLYEKIGFVRKRLMERPQPDMAVLVGTMGNRATTAECLCRSTYCFLYAPDDFSTICKTASLGGSAPLDASLVGALVGAYAGLAVFPQDMKDQLENGSKVEALGIKLAERLMA
jgi:ADP-ribosylglycohydrolase